MTDPPRDDPVPAGELDVPTLRTIGRRASDHPLVTSWRFTPSSASPRSLEIRIDASAYPPNVNAVRLDVHWFTTHDYYCHYVETREGSERGEDEYQCRWDRHPKTDAPKTHFHHTTAGNPGLQAEKEGVSYLRGPPSCVRTNTPLDYAPSATSSQTAACNSSYSSG